MATQLVAFRLRMRRAYTWPSRCACAGPTRRQGGETRLRPRAAPGSPRKSKLCLLTVQRHCFHGVLSPPPPRCPLNPVSLASEVRPGLCCLWRDAPGSPPCSSPPNGPLSPAVRGSGAQGGCARQPVASVVPAEPVPGLASLRGARGRQTGALFLTRILCERAPEETRSCRAASWLSYFSTHKGKTSFLLLGISKRNRSPSQRVGGQKVE